MTAVGPVLDERGQHGSGGTQHFHPTTLGRLAATTEQGWPVGAATWGTLLVGIASMITALTGAALGIYSVARARKEPRRAAEHAAEHLLHPSPDDEAALSAALEILLHHHPHTETPELPEGHHIDHPHHHPGGEAP